MINTFSDRTTLPQTRYRINKLFNPGGSTEKHAVCPRCNIYLGIFHERINFYYSNVCDSDIGLKDPSYRDLFMTFDIRNDIRNIVESDIRVDYFNDLRN